MHNVAKEPLSYAQTAKADVGGRSPSHPPSPATPVPQHIYIFIYIMGGGGHTICQNVQGFWLTRVYHWLQDEQFRGVPLMLSALSAQHPPPDSFSVASLGFTCRNEPHSLQAAVILTIFFSAQLKIWQKQARLLFVSTYPLWLLAVQCWLLCSPAPSKRKKEKKKKKS